MLRPRAGRIEVGLILDTNVLIDAERTNRDILEVTSRLADVAEGGIAVSAVTVMEFAAGIERAKTSPQRDGRIRLLRAVKAAFHVVPFGEELAFRTGLMSGELKRRGVVVETLDLIIGMTALDLSFAVATRNVRHFRLIPGLQVVEA